MLLKRGLMANYLCFIRPLPKGGIAIQNDGLKSTVFPFQAMV